MQYMELAQEIIKEVKRVVIGKDECIWKALAAILAGGHILIEDIPGGRKDDIGTCACKKYGTGLEASTVYTRYPSIRSCRIFNVPEGEGPVCLSGGSGDV